MYRKMDRGGGCVACEGSIFCACVVAFRGAELVGKDFERGEIKFSDKPAIGIASDIFIYLPGGLPW